MSSCFFAIEFIKWCWVEESHTKCYPSRSLHSSMLSFGGPTHWWCLVKHHAATQPVSDIRITIPKGQQLDMPIYPIYQVPCKTKSWPNVTCCRELQLEPNTSLHVACFACTVEGIGNAHYFHERFWEWFFGDDLPPLAIYAKYIMSPPKKIMW